MTRFKCHIVRRVEWQWKKESNEHMLAYYTVSVSLFAMLSAIIHPGLEITYVSYRRLTKRSPGWRERIPP